MSEYWKSTPSYWCKFCSQYVRDSPLERKNHDASGRHQNNISRSLRELHKGQERETREKQRAKDEVARLNGLFSDKPENSRDATKPAGGMSRTAPAPSNMNPAAQRRAHAEQLAAMGVALPEHLQKEVTGVGNFHVVSERAVEDAGVVSGDRSLAEILAEAKRESAEVKEESPSTEESKAARKRKLEHADDGEEVAPRRKIWGSSFKTYPSAKGAADDEVNLDALLQSVAKKKAPSAKTEDNGSVKQENIEGDGIVKQEEDLMSAKPLNTVPDVSDSAQGQIESQPAVEIAPRVVFKKRKGKK